MIPTSELASWRVGELGEKVESIRDRLEELRDDLSSEV